MLKYCFLYSLHSSWVTFFIKKQTLEFHENICNRRFASSFSTLRIEHRRVKNLKNKERLAALENSDFIWPVKETAVLPVPPQVVIDEVSDSDDGQERSRPAVVTMSGRTSGK